MAMDQISNKPDKIRRGGCGAAHQDIISTHPIQIDLPALAIPVITDKARG